MSKLWLLISKKNIKNFTCQRIHRKLQIVTIPKMHYIAIRGKGNPNDKNGAYQQVNSALYTLSYTLKMSSKSAYQIEGFFAYVVPPLEGFWWQDGVCGIDFSNKDAFQWISMIRLPDFVTQKDFDWAVETAIAKNTKKKSTDVSLGEKEIRLAEFFTIEEGLCVQIMHHGKCTTACSNKVRNPTLTSPLTREKLERFARKFLLPPIRQHSGAILLPIPLCSIT